MKLENLSARTVTLRDTPQNLYVVPAYGELLVDDALWSDTEFKRWLRMRIRDIVVVPSLGSTGIAASNEPYVTWQGTSGLTNDKTVGTDLVLRGTLASRPAAGIVGRLYVVTNSGTTRLTRDNGTTWDDILPDYSLIPNKPTTFNPTLHASTHISTGSDPLTGTLDATARHIVQTTGTTRGTRRAINFTSTNVTATDDAANERVNISIASGASLGTVVALGG